ncbi:beta-N-acetylhexosaminidase [Tamlana sp. 2201CG12-4]|uniref:beta-N-acetylhexosaminidase n=1 Tax=Tamlana sp. 2201CG12-4 TaxID=3112582 RepID=UPI002DBBCB56|nr:beta-N-acetylhexosaminidase [Tamlana sp. 2201CG12-4]MEC3908487.1 beta-N-acetylhexosaminidase [Tamlana sp. 2201CG12-4]
MNTIKSTFLVWVIIGMLALHAQASDIATRLGIVPRPKSVQVIGEETYQLKDNTKLFYDAEGKAVAQYLSDFLKAPLGYTLESEKLKKVKAKGIILRVDKELETKEVEGYSLTSNKDRIEIIGKSPAGLFYGVQTLLQLLPGEVYASKIKADVEWEIPSVQILDEPLFTRFRGLHVDVSRHFRTKEEMLQVVDYLAMHKMNTLHIHLTDDAGWRIEIKAYPKLTEIGAIGQHGSEGEGEPLFFTQKDLKEIIAYAKSRYIKVFPEIDMPGHMMATIKAYPHLKSPKDLREPAKVIRGDEKGLEFCRNVLKEVRDVFGEVPIHIGFDEINLGSKDPIYTDEKITAFAQALTTYVKEKLGVTPIVWDDAFEKGLQDKETLVHWWRPGKMHWWSHLEMTIDQKVQKLDQPYILSPANWTYFDMKNAEGYPGQGWAGVVSVDKIYNWEPFRDLVDADPTKRHLAQGIIGCTWSEIIYDFKGFQERTFPRIAALTEKAWGQSIENDPKKPDWQTWRDEVLIKKQLPRYEAMQIYYWSKDKPEDLVKVKAGKLD